MAAPNEINSNYVDENFERVFNSTPSASAIWRGETLIFEKVNQAYQALFPGVQLEGIPFEEALPQNVLRDYPERFRNILRTGIPFSIMEQYTPIQLIENGPFVDRYYNVNFVQLKNRDGSPYGVYQHTVDVTEQVLARKKVEASEAQLRLAQEQLTMALEGSQMGTWYIDLKTNVVTTSPGAAKIFGLSSINENVFDVIARHIHPEDQDATNKAWTEAVKNRTQYYKEYRIIKPDGEIVWGFSKGSTVLGSDGEPIAIQGVLGDISHRILPQLELEKSKANLEQTVNELVNERVLRERFVATLSHDLRTPLTAAKVSAQILSRKLSDPALQKVSFRISELMDRADSMIRDLLDVSFLKVGEKLPIKPSPMDLVEVCKETLEELSGIHGDRFRLDGDISVEGEWDKDAIRRILENLCVNAVKYGYPNSDITVRVIKNKDAANLEVFNKGVGISSQDQVNLFDPFRRSESVKGGKIKGWGLGLTLVKGLTEAHGGTVSLESTENVGTTFLIKLPYAQT